MVLKKRIYTFSSWILGCLLVGSATALVVYNTDAILTLGKLTGRVPAQFLVSMAFSAEFILGSLLIAFGQFRSRALLATAGLFVVYASYHALLEMSGIGTSCGCSLTKLFSSPGSGHLKGIALNIILAAFALAIFCFGRPENRLEPEKQSDK
jgi:hypothetical protein